MKKLMAVGSLLAVAGSLWAADAPAGKPAGSCKQIMQACEQAGYEKGMHKKDGKGLYKDCMDPILAGQSVNGVTVDPSVVSDCQAKRAKRKAAKQAAPTTPPASN